MTIDTLLVGTSGWHYTHWQGVFYPEGLTKQEWLSYYARQFRCVEINNSFYRLPEVSTLYHWSQQTPAQFQFAVKASRLITHQKKLHDCVDAVHGFLDRMQILGKKLGPVLFQLPPRWHVNGRRLEQFLRILPSGYRYAFEFRDPSWHTEDICDLLGRYGAAFCIYDLNGFQTPHVVSTDFVYVRLHGPSAPYSGSYPAHILRGWEKNLHRWKRKGQAVYLFFNNDQSGFAVKNARLLNDFLSD